MLAAIDVGSNTVRMLLGDVVDGRVCPIHYERKITRLKGGQSEKGLAPESQARTLSALNEFVSLAKDRQVNDILAVGTEALRSAPDGEQFAERVRSNIDIPFQVISGEEEAQLSCNGIFSAIDPVPEKAVTVDIGGGSTEISVIARDRILFRYSCPLGAIRLAEMHRDEQWYSYIDSHVSHLKSCLQEQSLQSMASSVDTVLVGTAGTITTLAAMDMGMTSYDWSKVNNYRVSRTRVSEFIERLDSISLQDRCHIAGMEPGREDLIVPGLKILYSLMVTLEKQELIVSDFGLLEGVLLKMAHQAAIH